MSEPGSPTATAATTGATGTSQAARRWWALDPACAPLDERSSLDLLAFAQALAHELKYVDAQGAPAGDWRQLLPEPALLVEAVQALADPARLAPERAAVYARPHVALLLAFVELLGQARAQLNDLGRRHLDHYFAQVLRMSRKAAVPDRVHVLVEPDTRAAAVELPAGALLQAGTDRAGLGLAYRTEQALMVHPVKVAALLSLRADIRRTGLREAALQYLVGGTRAEAFTSMLRIALGQPDPGGALALPIWAGAPNAAPIPAPAIPASTVIGFEHLLAAHDRLRRVALDLFMPLVDDYRSLIALRATRRTKDAPQWARINQLIEGAGKLRSANPRFTLVPLKADDFVGNLRQALGLDAAQYARYYDGLPEVKSAEQAYAVLDDQPNVQAFVKAKLFFPALADFRELMTTKAEIDADWTRIGTLVEAALRLKSGNPDALLPDAQRQLRDVDALLLAALGFMPAEGLDAFHAGFVAIERWFCLSAEQIDYLIGVGRRAAVGEVDARSWDKVYALCGQAHDALVVRLRRDALLAAAQPGIGARDARTALTAMLRLVLGRALDPQGLSDALVALAGLRLNAADAQYIAAINLAPTPSTGAIDWPRVATALELAQRNREAFVMPTAEQVVWRQLYAAADASAVLAPSVAEGETPRWKTFGSAAAGSVIGAAPPALIGWALASPLLALAEGVRTVELRLGCLAGGFDAAGLRRLFAPDAPDTALRASVNPFVVQLSGAKGWVEPSCDISWTGASMAGYPSVVGTDTSGLRLLRLTLRLDEKQPAIEPPSLTLHGLVAAAPVLRLLLRPTWRAAERAWCTAYPELHTVQVARLALQVGVTGLVSLTLRSDQAVLDAKKPFEPFGAQPAAGARLLIGHPELVAKALDSLVLRYRWMGAPADFKAQYLNYPGPLDGASFTARVGFKDGSLFAPAAALMPLFDTDTSAGVTRAVLLPVDPGAPAAPRVTGSDVGLWPRALVWELTGDFRHPAYPTLALQNAMAMASFVAGGGKPTPTQFLLNPPYTPKLKSLAIDYTSSTEVALADLPQAGPAAGLSLLHLHPFGSAPAAAELALPAIVAGQSLPRPNALPLLPAYDGEGALYIGLANLAAPLTLSLLLQVAEGSADPDVAPGPVTWSCLDGDRWVELHDGALLEDSTRGLINSGLLRLALRPVAPSSLLPGAQAQIQAGAGPARLYWLRAAIPRASAGVCDMVAVHPNAVVACFTDQGNAADHLAEPLPPGSITALAVLQPGVAKIKQPYSSFGGKPAEQAPDFNLRVSERLRHKQRALTPWDYERLVLEKFPQLHKAKCLRPGAESAPGQIDLIVVPNISHHFPFDPFEPKLPADVVRDIEAYLADKTPPFAMLRVRNAFFVPLKIRCGVRFMPGQDEGFCRQRLNDELNRFLSPWAYDEGADLDLGGAIYANSIIDFIDERDYVDYLAELRLFTTRDGHDVLVPEAADYHASAGRPDGVLVAARQHEFDVIAQADYRVEGFAGINYMKLELDFIVS